MQNQQVNSVLLINKTANIVTLTLNRPEVRNALNQDLIINLIQELEQLQDDPNIRAIVINATGDHFCAGADLEWMRAGLQQDESQNIQDALLIATLMRKVNTSLKPTVCVVKGSVYAGGLGLVACCDIVIAHINTNFCCSEVKIGLSPSIIAPYLANAIGAKMLRRWALTAEVFNTEQAAQMGLVHIVAKDDNELQVALTKTTTSIAHTSPQAIAATKNLLLQDLDVNSTTIESFTTKLNATLRVSPEGREGVQAFLEKRKPNYSE